MISIIIPIKNRSNLLKYGLNSFLHQKNKNFEIVISDQGSRDNLKEVIQEYRGKGLNIKCFIVDNNRCSWTHNDPSSEGFYCECVAVNVAVKKCSGNIVVLTQPEIIFADSNIDIIYNNSKYILNEVNMYPHVREISIIEIVDYNIDVLRLIPSCSYDLCCDGRWSLGSSFMWAISKSLFLRIGGMNEEYMAGTASNDCEFGARLELNGVTGFLNNDFLGVHVTHSRSYGGEHLQMINKRKFHEVPIQRIANVGYDWGSDSYIVDTF